MIKGKMKLFIMGGAALFLGAAFIQSGFADDLTRGKLLYQSNCLQCHGEKGDGKGPQAATLDPKPKDLTSSALTDVALEKAVVEGVSTVPMHSWANKLSKEDVTAVIKYTKTFQQ